MKFIKSNKKDFEIENKTNTNFFKARLKRISDINKKKKNEELENQIIKETEEKYTNGKLQKSLLKNNVQNNKSIETLTNFDSDSFDSDSNENLKIKNKIKSKNSVSNNQKINSINSLKYITKNNQINSINKINYIDNIIQINSKFNSFKKITENNEKKFIKTENISNLKNFENMGDDSINKINSIDKINSKFNSFTKIPAKNEKKFIKTENIINLKNMGDDYETYEINETVNEIDEKNENFCVENNNKEDNIIKKKFKKNKRLKNIKNKRVKISSSPHLKKITQAKKAYIDSMEFQKFSKFAKDSMFSFKNINSTSQQKRLSNEKNIISIKKNNINNSKIDADKNLISSSDKNKSSNNEKIQKYSSENSDPNSENKNNENKLTPKNIFLNNYNNMSNSDINKNENSLPKIDLDNCKKNSFKIPLKFNVNDDNEKSPCITDISDCAVTPKSKQKRRSLNNAVKNFLQKLSPTRKNSKNKKSITGNLNDFNTHDINYMNKIIEQEKHNLKNEIKSIEKESEIENFNLSKFLKKKWQNTKKKISLVKNLIKIKEEIKLFGTSLYLARIEEPNLEINNKKSEKTQLMNNLLRKKYLLEPNGLFKFNKF